MTENPHQRNDDKATMMTVSEVASYLRLSPAKVYRMAKAGQLPAIQIGRAWRFKRELLDEWIRQKSAPKQEALVIQQTG
jgi:excisionase family DNA binding protein